MTDQEILRQLDTSAEAGRFLSRAEQITHGEIPGREIPADPLVKKQQQDNERRQRYFDRLLDEVNSGKGWGW